MAELIRDGKGRVKSGQVLNPAGKPVGTRDKYHELCAVLAKEGHNPFEFHIMIARNDQVDWSVRERANKAILERYAPALKSIDYSISKDTIDNMLALKKGMLELQQKFEHEY